MKKKLSLLTFGALVALTVTGCNHGNGQTSSSGSSSISTSPTVNTVNETVPLVLSTAEFDGVFSPFFSTNLADSSIVGLTQIGMIGNNSAGEPIVGENEDVVVLDYSEETRDATDDDKAIGASEDKVTEYKFVLKNNIKYSNGSALSIKDVLFNLYVYLDPIYNGSSTIYSTDIVGLKRYRTQTASEKEQEGFKTRFQVAAQGRIDQLTSLSDQIIKDHSSEILTETSFLDYLTTSVNANPTTYGNVLGDYNKALSLFSEELNSDYTNAIDTATDISFTKKGDEDNLIKPFETNMEAFLYNEGYISFNKDTGEITATYGEYTDARTWTKEQCIQYVYADKVPYSISEIVSYWAAADNLFDYIVADEMEKYFNDQKNQGNGLTYKNISGITFANKDEAVTVNGKTYEKPTYDSTGALVSGNEVLSIKINGVDPKAIWNFAFTVAPMYYYSDQEHIEKFDFESNFGVEYMSQTFLNNVVNAANKVGLPVGAGPYQASKASGGTTNVTSSDFADKGVVYYERNENFHLGKPKIKSIRYQVTPANSMVTVLQTGEVDFVEPNAKPKTVEVLNGLENVTSQRVKTAGYGYIGINAGEITDLEVRQAIMHAISVDEVVGYYGTMAEPVYRSMSRTSWAYPKDAELYYAYDSTGATSARLVADAGYTLGSDGVLQKDGKKLKYTFTIAGEDKDHPAWDALYHAAEVLNRIGFQITVTTDARALSKLSVGGLQVWAAAWGSTIDPDMYQVYHKDSTATSVLNWGYKKIAANPNNYPRETEIIAELSQVIDDARSVTDQPTRTNYYAHALDLVMDLAVELPTYQRDDLFAYNNKKIDSTSLTPAKELSPYKGLLIEIWNVSLNANYR